MMYDFFDYDLLAIILLNTAPLFTHFSARFPFSIHQ